MEVTVTAGQVAFPGEGPSVWKMSLAIREGGEVVFAGKWLRWLRGMPMPKGRSVMLIVEALEGHVKPDSLAVAVRMLRESERAMVRGKSGEYMFLVVIAKPEK